MVVPTVGIIANPASGRDVRRFVAHSTVFDNHEKSAIVRRALLGLEAVGITRVAYMPEDDFGIVARAVTALHGQGALLHLGVEPLSMPVTGSGADSTRAAQLFVERGAACIITLGGDGTNRAVAKGCATTPLVPISTGTNNVFPAFTEGTAAGMAAALVALASGQVQWMSIADYRWLEPAEEVRLRPGAGTIALDGEREIELSATAIVEIRLCAAGTLCESEIIARRIEQRR